MRIIAELFGGEGTDLRSARLCQVCADITGMSGAGIMLMPRDVPLTSACSSNDVSAEIEDLQYTIGEGPCIDAGLSDRPVLEPDLANPSTPRWFGFTGPAVEAGARAVFGFPLQVGAVRFGALNLYRNRPGPLDEEQYTDALVMAEVAADAVLLMQADAPPGDLGAELAGEADLRPLVHQAAGMISAQLEVSVAEALIQLRAYAFGNDRRLVDVAGDVVERRLRFDEHRGEE